MESNRCPLGFPRFHGFDELFNPLAMIAIILVFATVHRAICPDIAMMSALIVVALITKVVACAFAQFKHLSPPAYQRRSTNKMNQVVRLASVCA